MKSHTPQQTDADFGARMLMDNDARHEEMARLKESLAGSGIPTELGEYLPGVSVIVPSYQGANRLPACLDSLAAQTLPPHLFEVIVVVNGEQDGSLEVLKKWQARHANHALRIIYQATPSAGAARNLGIALAAHAFTTFVDDDDYVGPEFLERMLAVAGPDTIGVSPIINVEADGTRVEQNPLNLHITAKAGKEFTLTTVPPLLGFNACKLIPTAALSQIRYSSGLRSGEDIAFMAAVAVSQEFKAHLGTTETAGAYFRVLRDESISRQDLTFDFAVTQRLDVMVELEKGRSWDLSANDQLLLGLMRSQAGFIGRYLDAHPHQLDAIHAAVESSAVRDFPWQQINKGKARDLVVSYCFAPFSDTSAVVAAKAIVERGNIVDVISNNMAGVRRKDSSLTTIAGRYVENSVTIDAPPSFAGWEHISEFVTKGTAVANRQDARVGGYRTLYSRVLWPGSHFLAARFKLSHPQVVWTAEFSDPVSADAKGRPRKGSLTRDALFEEYARGVRAAGFPVLKTDNLFEWCEFLTYVLADEITFTNHNQRDYMVARIANKKLRRRVLDKATVRFHPVPPQRSYTVLPSDYQLSPHVVNIGYFGAFYDNRGLDDVLTALVNAPMDVRRQVRLHVFTDRPKDFGAKVKSLGLAGNVLFQRYLPYLEFLNVSTRFDVLVVNDVERGGELPINPFLPSKYSDYVGSGSQIWGLVDEGSPLSQRDIAYKSPVGNGAAALRAVRSIHGDWVAARDQVSA
ncbi:glycosyltransferase [Arthrobacter sp. PAMC 25486]|uniref:glycosyltransferase n=1 Tax=Arthrobacter sp. PAMC 25486 TaxID=1494608 RepID=UPI0006924BD6|nr:glycosyltransferase [Arthrobacter sp. PAMC 25486]